MSAAKEKLATIATIPPSRTSAIYKICRIDNERAYIGQAIDVRSRWLRHIKDLEAGRHSNSRLQSDWVEVGFTRFVFEIIMVVPEERLDDEEQRAIDKEENPYNVLVVGLSPRGVKRSIETKRRLSESLQKRMKDPDVKSRLLEAAATRKASGGYVFSKEQIQKLRLAKLGKKHNHGAAIGDALRGRSHNHGGKISETLKKRPPHSEERRRKISLGLMGNKNYAGKK